MKNVSLSEQLDQHLENREMLNELKQVESETWDFALTVARGCVDYGGGYRADEARLAIFHHGIQTVVNALEAARTKGMKDTQVAALYSVGRDEMQRTEDTAIRAATVRLIIKDTFQPPIDTPASVTWKTHEVFDEKLADLLRGTGHTRNAEYHTLEVVGAELPPLPKE
jgi:hypothetical protein